mmetsp:Transcript_28380/g.55812  ORF Transcript_28380/g.55812 Transcript_28380/m.55812 type:complete len:129 (-) Transcript_28380:464-850(-)
MGAAPPEGRWPPPRDCSLGAPLQGQGAKYSAKPVEEVQRGSAAQEREYDASHERRPAQQRQETSVVCVAPAGFCERCACLQPSAAAVQGPARVLLAAQDTGKVVSSVAGGGSGQEQAEERQARGDTPH